MENQFEQSIKSLESPQEQAAFLAQALRYCADKVIHSGTNDNNEALTEEIEELKVQNEKLNERLENAKIVFHKQKAEMDFAQERIKAVIERNLQRTRDELYILGNALHAYAAALSEKTTAKMTLDEVNNLQMGIAEIIDNLQQNGLWNEEQNMKPDLTLFEKKEKPKKTKKKKKTEETAEQLSMVVEVTQEQQEG